MRYGPSCTDEPVSCYGAVKSPLESGCRKIWRVCSTVLGESYLLMLMPGK